MHGYDAHEVLYLNYKMHGPLARASPPLSRVNMANIENV